MQLDRRPGGAHRAAAGSYNIDDQLVAVDGAVRFSAADGYRMTARNVSIDLPAQLSRRGRGRGHGPGRHLLRRPDRADLDERTVTLDGNARLRMVPGQMRMP